MSAQTCGQDNLVSVDSILITRGLEDCEVAEAYVKFELGILNCNDVRLLPAGPYPVNMTDTIFVYDEAKNDIIGRVKLITKAEDITNLSNVTEIAPKDFLINTQIAFSECGGTKNVLLGYMGIENDPVLRSRIHFVKDGIRLTEFPLGDTVLIDEIKCGDNVFYQNVKVLAHLASAPFQGDINVDFGFSRCRYTIAELLTNDFGYDLSECDISRFAFSDSGPFGFGTHRIDEIKLDKEVIARNVDLNISAGECNTADIDFGMLASGKCALNEYDLIDTLGMSGLACGVGSIAFFPPGPYESSPVTIENISINGQDVCTTPFDVIFERDVITQEQGALLCVEDLNIAMGPECMTTINADVILASGEYCYLNYNIDLALADFPDVIIASGHEVTITGPGDYRLKISNPNTGNSCWAEFSIEDKYIKDYTCPPTTVMCYESTELIPDSIAGGGPEFPITEPGYTFEATSVFGKYDVSSPTSCDVVSASYSDEIVNSCWNGYKQVVDRLWTLEDAYGNQDTCLQRIYVQNTSLSDLLAFSVLDADCIGDFSMLDENGHPSPEITGYPLVRDSINAGICGTLKMTYRDSEVPACGNGFKIFREWVVIDWCSDQVETLTQIIRIEDKQAPVIIGSLEDITIDSDPFVCGGTNIDLPLPQFDDCNIDEVQVEVLYQTYDTRGNLVTRSNGSSLYIDEILTMDIISDFDVIYILTDPCGNESRDTITLTIEDTQPPTPVCDEFTAISVGGSGTAIVPAKTFDNLSVDNCGIAKYEARKLNGTCDTDLDFAEDIRFCCEEVGDTLLVEFKVTDLAGNYNFCEVSVHVQDKFRPVIIAPDDITLDCGEDYEDLTITGEATARDNCDSLVISYQDVANLNTCYQGVIERTWTVRDIGGHVVSEVQRITILEDDMFDASDIQFPTDTIVMGCTASLDPELTGRPILDEPECSMVDATHVDLPFDDVEGACQKILRTWTIIDWCQRDAANGGIWKMDQIIKIISEEAPIFEEQAEKVYCISTDACGDTFTVTHAAVDGDDCTAPEDLIWRHAIYDSTDVLVVEGEGAVIEAYLEKGTYAVVFEVVDDCDNLATDTLHVEVTDCFAPEISCPAVQPSLVLDVDGQVTLHISEVVDLTYQDNCTDSTDILISFAGQQEELVFTCDDLAGGLLAAYVKVYATDTDNNQDSCELYIEVRDNSDVVCNHTNDTISIAGRITNVHNDVIQGASAILQFDNREVVVNTDEDGTYLFDNLTSGVDYQVSFDLETSLDDGLTVTDLILIQRHILGLRRFDSPYDYIAADVNNNGKVSATDIVKLKRVLLGIDGSLSSSNQSDWRFVNAHQSFDNPDSPFPFEEFVMLDDLRSPSDGHDFMAIKIGDLNDDNSMQAQRAEIRSAAIPVTITEEFGSAVIRADRSGSILGLQLDLEVDRLTSLESGQLMISTDDYVIDEQGALTLIWHSHDLVEMEKGDVLFTLKNVSARDLLPIAGTWVDGDLGEYKVEFEMKQDAESIKMSVKNFPNPFVDQTVLQIELAKGGTTDIVIYNQQGQVILQENKYLDAGVNQINITAEQLQYQSGIFLVRVRTHDEEQVHRLTLVR